MNRIEEIEKKETFRTNFCWKKITEFFPGDTIKVNVRNCRRKETKSSGF